MPALAGRTCASLCDIATQTDRRLSLFALVAFDIPLELAPGPSAATNKILKYNGTQWVVADDAAGSGGSGTNVTISDTAPTSPTTAFGSGENVDNPMAMYLSDLLTIPANLAGLPAISLPCGFDKSGLPIGLQLIANVFEESKLLQVASQFENAANVFKNQPKTEFTF